MPDFELPPVKVRVAGISFDNRDGSSRQAVARLVRKGDRLHLRREKDNAYDPWALAVDWVDTDGKAFQLGYVPRGVALLLSPLVDEGATLTAHVVRKGGGQPMGVRMVIEGDMSALPEGRTTGLEPALRIAELAPDDYPEDGYAPVLGGDRRP